MEDYIRLIISSSIGYTNIDDPFDVLIPEGERVEFRLLSMISHSDWRFPLGQPLCFRLLFHLPVLYSEAYVAAEDDPINTRRVDYF